MKYFLLIFLSFISSKGETFAQTKQHKVVFELVSADTADHSAVLRQANNVLREAPDTKIEIVFHGKAIYALIKDKTTIRAKLDSLVNAKNFVVAACNNTLTRYNLNKNDVIPAAIIVPVAILELVKKQEEGWSYIKAGH